MKTVINAYCFDTDKPKEKTAYLELSRNLKKQGLKVFCAWGGKGHYSFVKELSGETVTLDTKHIFNNQWNTEPIPGFSDKGLRVFDWAEDYPINFRPSIKRGHYLTQIPEMSEVRRNTVVCGYCGSQEPAQKGYIFCPHCLGSEYLKKSDLRLTRYLPVCDSDKTRPELSEAEAAHLLPLYKAAQLYGNSERDKARIKKQREDMLNERDRAIKKAQVEFDGKTWILDKGLKIENVIYYSHRDIFTFGWRKPVDPDTVNDILGVISEFPFNYEIICDDGRKLSNI